MNRKWIVAFVALLALAIAIALCGPQLVLAYQRIPTGLEYDGVRVFHIANQRVTIETRSISLGNGDDGDAEIVVSSGGNETTLTSRFSDDMWTYVKPAYISWDNVDDHSGRDLLIWKPLYSTQGPLQASEYISSENGELRSLQAPRERPIPGAADRTDEKQQDAMTAMPNQNDHRWSVVELDFDSTPLFVRINETARSLIGHADLGIKLEFAIPMRAAVGTNLPDPTENEALATLEDKIIETVANSAEGIHVLTITNATMKELVFYIQPGADIAAMHQSLRGPEVVHDVQCQAVWDREWNTFIEFLPDQKGE